MKFGYRVRNKEEVGLYDSDLVQISFYNNSGMKLKELEEVVLLCRDRKIRYVIHPIDFLISDSRPEAREKTMENLRFMAERADLGLIIHDERTSSGSRLFGPYDKSYSDALWELQHICSVSVENAVNSHDAEWFWRTYASSITMDIGHLESAGIDSYKIAKTFPSDLLNKLEYIHLHRNNGFRDGLTDHWPITRGCKEVKTLKELLRRKPEINVILEINETEQMKDNLRILRDI